MTSRNAAAWFVPVPGLVAFGLSTVLTETVWHFDRGPSSAHNAVTMAMAVISLVTLVATFGIQFHSPRRAVLMRTTSMMFAVGGVLVVLLFALLDAGPIPILLMASTVLLLMALAHYAVYNMAESTGSSSAR